MRKERTLCFVLLCPAVLLAGCVSRPLKAASTPQAPPQPLPKGVEGQGISVNWLENMPNGAVQHVLDIKAESGTATTGTRSGKFNEAKGFFYQNGRRVLRFEAPVVNAAEEKKTVVASGRVKALSLEPAGVTVEADRVTWLIPQNKVVAEGNVTLRYQRPGDPVPIAWGGPVPRLTIDTELKKFSIP
jgi:hypothetical protein